MNEVLRTSSLSLLFLVAAACSSSSSSGGTDGGMTGADAGALPTISITLEAGDGGTASLAVQHMMLSGADATVVPIPFTTTNFTLVAPGMCSNNTTDNDCGHIHIYVDDSACTPDGAPYDNADATGSPAIAILSSCPMVDGMHTVRLELHHGDHSPVLGAGGMVIEASAAFTATGQ